MVLLATYWLPHGDELIDLPNDDSRTMARKISEVTSSDSSEVRVVISPHGLGLSRNIGVIMTENFNGSFSLATGNLRARYKNDRILAGKIADSSLDVVEKVTFATGSGPKSAFPVDFGSLIPLHFFKRGKVVLIGQPRFNRGSELVAFGKTLYGVLNSYRESVSMIFSADMAHTHAPDGSYGFSEQAAIYDKEVQEMFKSRSFGRSLEIPEDIVTAAKPDSFWNLLIMSGFLEAGGISMKMDYYYVEHYFGMLFAHS